MRNIVNYIVFLSVFLWVACANPGNPDGGPYDETPPQVTHCTLKIKENLEPGTKACVYFNEMVKLENAADKVVVSPPQINMPEISSKGKYIQVKLEDSLQENTTYTIDFSDAITDNNEGNPLGSYAFVFTTGKTIDSMQVSGSVLNAENLEPVKGILVGLQSDTTDVAFTQKTFSRVARTNGSGQFTIKGVAPGTYKIYALEDADGDFRYSQKSEMIAFLPATITPSSFPDIRMDTIWHDSIYYDSIVPVPYTHYMPDDVVLRAFTANHANRHLLKTQRSASEHFEAYFTGPSTERPTVKGLNFDATDAFEVSATSGNDTLQYWIKDTTLIYMDTLSVAYTYQENDSIGQLVSTTDTIDFVPKVSHAQQAKWAEKEYKKWKKQQEKNKKKGRPYETTYPVPELTLETKGGGSMNPNENIHFNFKEPVAHVDTQKIRLYLQKDSVYVKVPYLLRQDDLSIMDYTLYADWRPNQQYKLSIDSAAFTSIYQHSTDKLEVNTEIPSLDTYGSLFVNVTNIPDAPVIVQLLTQDKPVDAAMVNKGTAEFYFIKPGKYYLRLFVDRNNNGKWDEGDFDKQLLPEETYYFPEVQNIRAKWDSTLDWDVMAYPLNKQKPLEITKQKPDQEKTIKNRNADRKNRR